MTAPAPQSQPSIVGYREAEGHAASLLQQALWIEESVDGSIPPERRLDLGDVDTDELRSSAQLIMSLSAKVDELTAALREIEADCARYELTLTLPYAKGVKRIWKLATDALAVNSQERAS